MARIKMNTVITPEIGFTKPELYDLMKEMKADGYNGFMFEVDAKHKKWLPLADLPYCEYIDGTMTFEKR